MKERMVRLWRTRCLLYTFIQMMMHTLNFAAMDKTISEEMHKRRQRALGNDEDDESADDDILTRGDDVTYELTRERSVQETYDKLVKYVDDDEAAQEKDCPADSRSNDCPPLAPDPAMMARLSRALDAMFFLTPG